MQTNIPLADFFEFHGPTPDGQCMARFYAFNTVVTLQSFAARDASRAAFLHLRDMCRMFEGELSRTLPDSGISRLNESKGEWVEVSPLVFNVVEESLRYCRESLGVFDITMGSVVRLWDFKLQHVPDCFEVEKALKHVDFECIKMKKAGDQHFLRTDDPDAQVDVGGTAKGYVADVLCNELVCRGFDSFVINLGGNVVAHGLKPDGSPWRVGLQDPRFRREDASGENPDIIGFMNIVNASAVTSGVNERSFEKNGCKYHHILDTQTGYPVQTDAAAVTVISQKSMDAEGYSTTLLALGSKKGKEFVEEHPQIIAAYFIDEDGRVM